MAHSTLSQHQGNMECMAILGESDIKYPKELIELKGAIQTYAWGKLGSSSIVAQLYKNNDPDFIIDEGSTYAELWMGTHINGPSSLKSTGQILHEWLRTNLSSLGKEVLNKFGVELPFLFKVLSVNKALSIQAHPSKAHAEQLHKAHPEIYKDSNHKPELAIALTEFEALCGFRPLCEIKLFIKDITHLQHVIGLDVVEEFLNNENPENKKLLLKKCFQQLMNCPKDLVEESLKCLMEVIEKGKPVHLSNLLKRLYEQFPGDVGCYCIYFLNHVYLSPGESMYLGPNIPHAYLSGDCIECMACSDNVVRAGLTPKFRDVKTLSDMLIYESSPADSVKFKPIIEDAHTKLYKPPVPDFAVANIMVSKGSTYHTIPRKSGSIMLVVEGEGLSGKSPLKEGTIIFLPAGNQLAIKSADKIVIYQALANL